jgi:hypothetical protein
MGKYYLDIEFFLYVRPRPFQSLLFGKVFHEVLQGEKSDHAHENDFFFGKRHVYLLGIKL